MEEEAKPRAARSKLLGCLVPLFALGLLGPLCGAAFGIRGCVAGKSAMQTFLEQQRGKPPRFEPHHTPETRLALEQLSRASRVQVELPSSMKGGWGAKLWCGGGSLSVGGREVPFGILFSETLGKQQVDEMSLTRLRCVSHKRAVSLQ